MTRNRFAVLLGTLAIAAVPLAASPAGASAATVELRQTSYGEILTDSRGFTLFVFSADPKKMDVCITIMNCTGTWPPLFAEGPVTAGAGVNPKKLSTITLPGGAMQVTYSHRALYGYVGNVGAGETSYVNAFEFGGYWRVMNAKGKVLSKPPKPKV
jgi:predicted lipoprotein with Yx(FWY)xxD motif